MNLRISLVLSSLVSLLSSSPAAAEEKTVVQSVNYPLHYFATRLATDSFEVNYLVDPEVDPAFWKPDDKSLMAFQKADLIVRNGADYEKWMKTVSLPSAKMVDTSKEFSSTYIKTAGSEHRHGNGTVHSHAGTAFTTWIDFSQAGRQAEAIAARFKALQPADAVKINENLTALKSDLDALDSAMKAFGVKWEGKPLVASHPIYQYFARAYDLKIEAIEWEPEMEITDKDLADLKKMLGKHKAEWMIWEDQPTAANIAAISALGLKSVVFSPCANIPGEGDWLAEMKRNLANLEGLLNTAEPARE